MTERFMVDDCGTLIDMTNRNTYDYVSDVCGLLNELHEENQKCKEYNGILYANHTKTDRELIKQISELKQENEQLKSLNKYLIELLKDLNGVSIEIERVIE